ncbi:hypothetical protein JYQ29_13995 [Curtobacterium flaccumfaciens pv. flaccumfaciens]|uniref:hypothetical protein n=1 Tax=Curtobacterium flaccumfaciens TaxID=2035 RepID=UPI001ADBEC56|nr:hypothetical protein [Curtobacterium flaccumfaciens]MBO9048168.1 hypothetical protein [Curtobacterium flaccumfaciens pv. flaccumfaciens]MBO9058095.1 hypothetical protein [Curtobacterium flaccumfaciens pv. flaccumfaciens]QTR90235.1 hypothetical protein JG550_002957 [Curtobacterium flaccumfaciens pv. flaccumfaciens]QVG65508.1 hypothetical protein JG551_002940 [Curtobacterium flaccumfaciens pv. flaccumfaciens]
MSNENRVYRAAFGRPSISVGVAWLALGVVWAVLAILDPAVWRAVLAAVWIVLGSVTLAVSLRDKNLGLGRYQR